MHHLVVMVQITIVMPNVVAQVIRFKPKEHQA